MREKWFPEVHHHCPGVPCLIVGTQTDLRDDPQVRDKLAKQKMQPVRKEDGERMAKELGAVKYVECSALTQFKLKDVFDEVNKLHSFVISYHSNTSDIGDRRGARATSNKGQKEEQALHHPLMEAIGLLGFGRSVSDLSTSSLHIGLYTRLWESWRT